MTESSEPGLREGEIAIDLPASVDAGLYFIGIIHTPFRRREDCPRNGAESDALCVVEVFERYADALLGIETCAHLDVLYWLHLSARNIMCCGRTTGPSPRRRPSPLRSPARHR
ncbi:MAG: tRNA (N6-threonylcarbamoyladenosine(37)-N6)-methyltransferase TrmO, partial [Methylacidiphilales bacterium]|nr:tRNA (N6-threonylcarbamoyladenosine(37)-N6)-methyltransferase TrmO [Candidatus Methylacidiphilales bacterium]